MNEKNSDKILGAIMSKRPLTVRIDEAVYKQLKLYSVERELPIQVVVELAIAKYMEKKVK